MSSSSSFPPDLFSTVASKPFSQVSYEWVVDQASKIGIAYQTRHPILMGIATARAIQLQQICDDLWPRDKAVRLENEAAYEKKMALYARLWLKIHTRPWSPDWVEGQADEDFWDEIVGELMNADEGCQNCAEKLAQWRVKNPFDYTTRDSYFAGTVALHNFLNAELQKKNLDGTLIVKDVETMKIYWRSALKKPA